MSLLTPNCIASYTQGLWKAARVKDKKTGKEKGDPKYGCELIFDPTVVDMTDINDAIKAAFAKGFPNGIPKNPSTGADADFHWPLMKGELYKPGDPMYAGKLIMRVGRKEDFGPPLRVFNDGNYTPIADQTKLYSGCIVQANINIDSYDMGAGSQGITAYLNGVILIGDGDRLDNSQTAEQMFGGVKPGSSSAGDAPPGMQTDTGGDAPAAGNPWD